MNHYEHIRQLIEGQGSRIVSVEFIKADGSYRKMLVQSAATAPRVKGELASEQAQRAAETRRVNNPNLLNIYDMDRRHIRSINMDTLLRITGSGVILWSVKDYDQRIAQLEVA